jgi:AraC family transcriptional regulator
MERKEENKNADYLNRINSVIDYIKSNYHRELSLVSLAAVAHFSPYHFHRIFKSIVGESLYKYIQRIRIEKAAHSLKYDKNKSITEIAFDCGFNNSASFARTFKEHFNMSATTWRKGGYKTFSKNCKEQSKKYKQVRSYWQDVTISPMYIDATTNIPNWRISMIKRSDVKVEVKDLAETSVAYIRHIGEFKGETKVWAGLFEKLKTWAAARGLIKCPETQFFTVFRDDLKITEFSKFIADVCISVAPNTKSDGEIGVSAIPSGKYAVAQFEIDGSEFEEAWETVYSGWLPKSGFQPDERFCFERYLNDPEMHPQKKHIIEICIPVKAM